MEKSNFTSEGFAQKFNLNQDEKENLVLFSGGDSIGFSIKKNYPNNIIFKPAVTIDGKEDSVAVIWIGYKHQKEESGKVPIYLRISKESKYLMDGHYDYNFSDKDSPTKLSLEISNKTKSPVELESYLEYFFDTDKKIFIKDGKEINSHKIIDDIYNQHIKTVHKFKGIPFRSKKKLRNVSVNSLRSLVYFIKWILKIVFGRNLEKKGNEDIQNMFLIDLYTKEDLLPTSPSKISILGFDTNTTKQSILSICFLVVICGALNVYIFNINFERIKLLTNNQIYIGAFLILGIHIFDYRLTYLLLLLINLLIKIKNHIMFMKIKVR